MAGNWKVGAVIRRAHAVQKYTFLSQADAYRVFRARFADQLDLLASTTADQLPTSFRIALAKGAKAKPLVKKLQHLPGVDEVKYNDRNNAAFEKMVERACRTARHTSLDFEVFLKVDATAAQTAAVRAALNHSTEVARVKFVSKDAALREMRSLFANSPKLAASVPANSLPASFRVDLRKHAHVKQLTRRLNHLPGVEQVESTPSLRSQCQQSAIGQTLDPMPYLRPVP